MSEREQLEAADADLLWRRLALTGERHALAPCQFLDERRRADDPAGREERISRSRDYVRRFEGSDVAGQVMDVYRRLLEFPTSL